MSEADTTHWKLATLEESVRDYRERLQHQCRLNQVLINQNAALIERNTELGKKCDELTEERKNSI